MNMYESVNKTDVIVSIPSYYSSILMENKIRKIIELCDYKNVEILPDYEAIGLSYAYKNKEELKETKDVMILQIDSISTSSTIIHMNTVFILYFIFFSNRRSLRCYQTVMMVI